MDIDNKGGWTECFTVHGVRLPLGYYFGASATTGQLAGGCPGQPGMMEGSPVVGESHTKSASLKLAFILV